MRRLLSLLLFGIFVLLPTPRLVAQESPTTEAKMNPVSPETEPALKLDGAAIEIPEKTDPMFTLSFAYWSRYLSSGSGAIYHDGPVLQTDLTISLGHGLYADLWYSTGLNGGGLSSDAGDEFDMTIGWEGEIESLGGLTINTGIAYFDLLPIGSFGDTDVAQPFIEFTKDFEISERHTLSPYLRFEFVFGEINEHNGEFYTHVGLKHSFEIFDALSFDQKFNVCHDPGIYGFDPAVIGEYSFGLTWSPEPWLTVTPIQGRISTPFSHVNDGRGTDPIWGMGVSISF